MSFVCGFAQPETFFSVPEESLPNLRILVNDTPNIKKYAHTFIFLLFYFDILDHALRRMTPLRDRSSPLQVNTSFSKACWVGVKIRKISLADVGNLSDRHTQ